MCSRNLCNLEIALHIHRIQKLHANLEIAWHQCESQGCPISVACTIEPRSSFKVQLCIKVGNINSNIRNSCSSIVTVNVGMYSSLQCQKLLGNSPTQRNSLPLGFSTGGERSQTCGVQGFTNSYALTLLVHCIHELCLHNPEIDCAISGLVHSFRILRLCSVISRWHKFLDCTEHNAYCSVSELQQSFPMRVTGISLFQRSNLLHSIHMSLIYLLNLVHQQLLCNGISDKHWVQISWDMHITSLVPPPTLTLSNLCTL